MYKAWNSAQAKSSTAIWDCFSLWGNCLAALSSSAAKISGVSRWRFRDRNTRETLGGEAVLSVLVGSNLGATMKWQKAVCWRFPAARESRQVLAHSESRDRLLQSGDSSKPRHTSPNQSSSAPGCLTGAQSELDALFFEFCTVAMNTESGPQQSQAPFRAIHTKYHFEHRSNSPCPASHAFKELWAHHFSEKLPGFLIIIIIIQSWFFPGPTDLFKHSQSPVEESRLLTSTLLIWSSPQIKNNSRQL